MQRALFFGVVSEVDHTYTFTTAKVIPSVQVMEKMSERADVVYINVWSSRNHLGRFRGVKFCGIEYPGDRKIAGPDCAPTTKGAEVPVEPENMDDEWTVIKNRKDERIEKSKTLVCPSEVELARIDRECFNSRGILRLPTHIYRVPKLIPAWVSSRCRCMPGDDERAFAWKGDPTKWKEDGGLLSDIKFPGVSKSGMMDRLLCFAKPNAVYLKELDYFAILRGIFAVEVEAWEPGVSALEAYEALVANGIATSHAKCREYQHVGAWILDVAWTELRVRGGVERSNVFYLAIPNMTYGKMKGAAKDEEPFPYGNEEKIWVPSQIGRDSARSCVVSSASKTRPRGRLGKSVLG